MELQAGGGLFSKFEWMLDPFENQLNNKLKEIEEHKAILDKVHQNKAMTFKKDKVLPHQSFTHD